MLVVLGFPRTLTMRVNIFYQLSTAIICEYCVVCYGPVSTKPHQLTFIQCDVALKKTLIDHIQKNVIGSYCSTQCHRDLRYKNKRLSKGDVLAWKYYL